MAKKVFGISADYCPPKDGYKPPTYYVVADEPQEAQEKGRKIFPWLKIYGCEEVTDQDFILEMLSKMVSFIHGCMSTLRRTTAQALWPAS